MTSSRPDSNADHFSTDVLVVGAGPAGLFQLFQLGLQGLSCHAIDALPHPGGQCAELYPDKPIYDIPALACVTGSQLSAQLHQQLAPFAIGWHWGHTVVAIDESAPGAFVVHTDLGHHIACKAIVLATGVGAFVPRKPKLEHLEALLAGNRHAFLQSHDRQAALAGQRVVVFGGDEAAVLKAIDLAQLPPDQRPSSISLLHRRDVFKADESALAQLTQLREQGRIQVQIGQIQALNTTAAESDPAKAAEPVAYLESLQVLDAEGQSTAIAADVLLVYQGIVPKLGALLDWELTLQSKQIVVETATQATNRAGIYAIGDIATYPGKRKLIATAFHEGIMAAYAIAEYVSGKSPLTVYTTTSTLLLERLGQAPVAKT